MWECFGNILQIRDESIMTFKVFAENMLYGGLQPPVKEHIIILM